MKRKNYYTVPAIDMVDMELERLMTASFSDQLHQDDPITNEDEILQRLQSVELFDE